MCVCWVKSMAELSGRVHCACILGVRMGVCASVGGGGGGYAHSHMKAIKFFLI